MTVRESSIWLVGLLACVACSDGPTLPVQDEPGSVGARWATWVLQDGSVLRPSPPPAASSEQARLEIEEIVRLQSRPGWEAEVRRWEGAPSLPWTHQTLDLLEFYWPLLPDVRVATPARAARIMALLHVAQYDALVATWDAKYSYQRPPPFVADSRVHAAGAVAGVPSYPSEHAAVAGAAAVILSYAFAREDTAEFQADARRAAESRIAAGVAYRSDVEAGLALGRAVAERVIQRAMADGSDAVWAGSVPQGENRWRPTPPRRVSSPF
ncbi:MAG: phosphatase PAP2 family protein, partial [Gemmatimonadota bacterium]|nr:phosphatase PAP2 family protein [Gemmatimonadota bacterium]